jgi:hypothetical protein
MNKIRGITLMQGVRITDDTSTTKFWNYGYLEGNKENEEV